MIAIFTRRVELDWIGKREEDRAVLLVCCVAIVLQHARCFYSSFFA